nr:hypothetical protein [Polyangiaceae bacterium]
MVTRAFTSAVLIASLGCSGAPPAARSPGGAPSSDVCASAAEPRVSGRVDDDRLQEISGIAASRRQPGVFFVHNDSGDSPRFFAVNAEGRTLSEFTLPLSRVLDVEDVAVGPGPGGKSYVYLADIGDNVARTGLGLSRPVITVYRVAEPELKTKAAGTLELSAVDALDFTYPDRGHDAEVLLVDPVSGDIHVVSKENDGQSIVFRASAPLESGPPRQLQEVTRLVFGRGSLPGNHMPTAGDVAPAGQAIVIRTYSSIFVWARPSGASIAEALRGTPREVPTPRQPQGEAVTFAADGRGLYTISEQAHQPLFFVACE